MKSLLPFLKNWTTQKETFAIARVIKTWGSSPRPIGSALLVNTKMEMQGSVSGGCVEGAVAKASLKVIDSGKSNLLSFGVADEEAWAVGLSCGGKVDVFVERFMAFDERSEEQVVWEQLQNCLEHNEACILLTKLEEGEGAHSLVLPNRQTFGQALPDTLVDETIRCYQERKNQVIEYGDTRYFVQLFPRKSQMFIIGAAHITTHLVELAKLHDFETIVIDPRGFFAQGTQFATPPDKILEAYPQEVLKDYTLDAFSYAVILSHDPKIDDNALQVLLKAEVAYIGALGSNRTHKKRIKRLEEAGFSEAEIARIHAPIGMDINAKSPVEIALSVMGEIIREKNKYHRKEVKPKN
ncbi:MAG: XdhC family protein [Bacteroidota bacterium]